MTYDYAKHFKMPFGKYKGRTLDNIAQTDDGLLYLDWLSGQEIFENKALEEALKDYLSNEAIQKDLNELVD